MHLNIQISFGLIILFVLLFIITIVFVSSCGIGKKYTSDYIEYQGRLDGDYRYDARMVDKFYAVKECMGVTWSAPFPNLEIRGCEEFADCKVNAVKCPGIAKPVRGCYMSGSNTVILPANVKPGIIDHEFVHHFCNITPDLCPNDIQPSDPLHTSEYFLTCSGTKVED